MIQRERFCRQEKNGIDRLREKADQLIQQTYEWDNRSGILANGGLIDEIAGLVDSPGMLVDSKPFNLKFEVGLTAILTLIIRIP
jgi:hypothetical protein